MAVKGFYITKLKPDKKEEVMCKRPYSFTFSNIGIISGRSGGGS